MPESDEDDAVLGVDLGTGTSAVAMLIDGDAVVLENDIGGRTTPSCALLPCDHMQTWDIGALALQHEIIEPERTIQSAKQYVEHLPSRDSLWLSSSTAKKVVAEIFKHLVAFPQMNTPFKTVAVSVPSYFGLSQRQGFLQAVFESSVQKVILVEDIAAALASYASRQQAPKCNSPTIVAIIDSGAGGSSVAVALVRSCEVDILEVSKTHLPAGDHFDNKMVDYIIQRIRNKTNLEVSGRDIAIIKRCWKVVKHKISRIPEARLVTYLPNVNLEIDEIISRHDFEVVCTDLFTVIVREVLETLQRAQVTVDTVDEVVLVGGSARIPFLRQLLQYTFAEKVCKVPFDPDEAVVKGLVLIGNGLTHVTHQKKISWYTGSPLFGSSPSFNQYDHLSHLCVLDDTQQVNSVDPNLRTPHDDNDSLNDTEIEVVGESSDFQNPHAPDSDIPQDNVAPEENYDKESHESNVHPQAMGTNIDASDHTPSDGGTKETKVEPSSQSPEANVNNTQPDINDQRPIVTGTDFLPANSADNDPSSAIPKDASKIPKSGEIKSAAEEQNNAPQGNNTNDATNSDSEEGGKTQFSLNLLEVLSYLKTKVYPSRLSRKKNQGAKKNFRRQCRPFLYDSKEGKLKYRPVKRNVKITTQSDVSGERDVILDESEQQRLIKEFHEGTENSTESAAMGSHRGRDRLIDALKERFYWQGMYEQAKRYCQLCITCKAINDASLKLSDPMHPVGVPTRHMAQLGIDITQMPEVDGYKYIIVAVDYFTKWVEAEPIKDKSMGTVARFLYINVLCRHSCPETIITDQGRDFCHKLTTELMRLCGGRHGVTSAYHPQANGLVERVNRAIKNAMLKVLQSHVEDWPYVLPGVLFAQRTSVHSSTKFAPFYVLYGRHPRMPGQLPKTEDGSDLSDASDRDDGDEWNLDRSTIFTDEDENEEAPFDMNKFRQTMRPMDEYREKVDKAIEENIRKAQEKQRRGYNKRHTGGPVLKHGDLVFVVNQRKLGRKGGKYEMPKEGPYTVHDISDRKRVKLLSKDGKILKTGYPIAHLQLVHIPEPTKDKRKTRPKDETPSNDTMHETGNKDKNSSEKVKVSRDSVDLTDDNMDKQIYDNPALKEPAEVSPQELEKFLEMPDDRCIVSTNGYKIVTEDLRKIQNNAWLNDTIMNAYLKVVASEYQCVNKMYFFSSFLLPELRKKNFTIEWIQKVNIFSYKQLIVPIHEETLFHWTLCAIDNEKKEMTSYDSLRGKMQSNAYTNMAALEKFLNVEHVRAFGVELPAYSKHLAPNPIQSNTRDCGVFVCFFARRLAQQRTCLVDEKYISNMRGQISIELLAAKLLPDDFIKKDSPVPSSYDHSFPGKGISNMGNTCYVNSCLQALFHIIPFATWLGEENHGPKCDKVYCLTCALVQVYKDTREKTDGVVKPEHLVACVKDFWKDFKKGRMEDAQEFLSLILQRLDAEHAARPPLENKEVQFYPTSQFALTLMTTTRCKCGSTQLSTQNGLHIAVSMVERNVRSLETGLQAFTKVDNVHDYKCDECKQKTVASKTVWIDTPPEVLTVHVCRYSPSGRKISRSLQTPDVFDLRPFMTSCSNYQGPTRYKLIGYLNHHGSSLHGGHYTVDMLCGSGFFNFDDDMVSPVPEKDLLADRAYVLLYKKIE